MADDPSRRGVDSSRWTGSQPEYRGLPASPGPVSGTRLTALLLLGAFLLLWVAWWMLLSFHSPTVAVPATGHTEPLRISQRGPALYVTPVESMVSTVLACAAFVVPAIYLGASELLRRIGKRRG